MLKEAVLPLQVAWGEESQVDDHVVGHILVVEGAQQLLQAGLFLTELDQVHELQDTSPVLLTGPQSSVSKNRHASFKPESFVFHVLDMGDQCVPRTRLS